MKKENIKEAIDESKRFIEKANNYIKLLEKEEKIYQEKVKQSEMYYTTSFPKESGAVRRSSLDLWRSLSKMRNSI